MFTWVLEFPWSSNGLDSETLKSKRSFSSKEAKEDLFVWFTKALVAWELELLRGLPLSISLTWFSSASTKVVGAYNLH